FIASRRGQRPEHTNAGHICWRARWHARARRDRSVCRPNRAFDRLAVAGGLDTRRAETNEDGRVRGTRSSRKSFADAFSRDVFWQQPEGMLPDHHLLAGWHEEEDKAALRPRNE